MSNIAPITVASRTKEETTSWSCEAHGLSVAVERKTGLPPRVKINGPYEKYWPYNNTRLPACALSTLMEMLRRAQDLCQQEQR